MYYFIGALSGLRQFLATEHPLKIMKIDFYFTLKDLFALETFQFFFWIFGHEEKWLDKKAKVTNNYNVHFARYLKK